MNVIITESQYKTIINENIGEHIEKIAKKLNKKVLNTINNVAKQYAVNTRFALTYGSAIGSLIISIESYLKGEFPALEPWQISGLVITAISVVFFTTKDYLELKKKLESEGLDDELKSAISFTEKLKDKFADLLNILGVSIFTLKDMAAYTFLLPVLGTVNNLVTNFSVDSIQFDVLVEAILTSGLITTSGVVIRDVLQSVANRISKKSPNEMGDENI